MSRAERDEVTELIRLSVGAWQETQPPEGTAHAGAIRGTLDRLERHFRRRRRGLFLASNLLVEYKDEAGFAPDLMAVLDVPLGDDRMSWDVEHEGRGLDFALEVLFAGNAKKDLRENVEWFARLGIREYFVFDGRSGRIAAWRLLDGSERYTPILPQYGAFPSEVLGVEFAVVDGRLRVFQDGLEVASAEDEIGRLVRMVDEREERLAVEAERARVEAERAAASLAATRLLLESLLKARGLSLDPASAARLAACDDPAQFGRWAERALTATTTAEALD